MQDIYLVFPQNRGQPQNRAGSPACRAYAERYRRDGVVVFGRLNVAALENVQAMGAKRVRSTWRTMVSMKS